MKRQQMTEILWKHATNMNKPDNEAYIPWDEAESIIDDTLQLQTDSLRKELFAFNKWMCRKQYDGEIPLISKCIDEYLKQRNRVI